MITLNPGERIYLIRRKHPIVLWLQLLSVKALFSFLIVLIIIFAFFNFSSFQNSLSIFFLQFPKYNFKIIVIFLLSLFFPFFWDIIFLIITSYLLTYWVVTNQRIIFVQLKSLFNIEYTIVSFEKIQDISIFIKGILPSIFHFGDVRIQTAGEKGEFLLRSIPNPEVAKQIIFEAKLDWIKKYGQSSY